MSEVVCKSGETGGEECCFQNGDSHGSIGGNCCICCNERTYTSKLLAEDDDTNLGCYCNCCACLPPSLSFSITEAEIRITNRRTGNKEWVDANLYTSCAIDSWEFEMQRDGGSLCYESHSEARADQAQPAGHCRTQRHIPNGFVGPYFDEDEAKAGIFPDAYGYKGTVCEDCTPPQRPSHYPLGHGGGVGQLLMGTLCCCKTGTKGRDGVPDDPDKPNDGGKCPHPCWSNDQPFPGIGKGSVSTMFCDKYYDAEKFENNSGTYSCNMACYIFNIQPVKQYPMAVEIARVPDCKVIACAAPECKKIGNEYVFYEPLLHGERRSCSPQATKNLRAPDIRWGWVLGTDPDNPCEARYPIEMGSAADFATPAAVKAEYLGSDRSKAKLDKGLTYDGGTFIINERPKLVHGQCGVNGESSDLGPYTADKFMLEVEGEFTLSACDCQYGDEPRYRAEANDNNYVGEPPNQNAFCTLCGGSAKNRKPVVDGECGFGFMDVAGACWPSSDIAGLVDIRWKGIIEEA